MFIMKLYITQKCYARIRRTRVSYGYVRSRTINAKHFCEHHIIHLVLYANTILTITIKSYT